MTTLNYIFIKVWLILNLSASPGFNSHFECFEKTDHFTFYREDNNAYPVYIEAFENSYKYLIDKLNIKKEHAINIKIFSTQKSYVTEIYGRYNSKITSVGMAKPDEKTIYITSYFDGTTGRDLEEYKRVVTHELTHILYYNEKTWLSEGLALYLAGQKREIIALPESPSEIKTYIDYNITNREAYGYYCWLSRYIIETTGFEAFIKFYNNTDDWNLIGFHSKDNFCECAYKKIILKAQN